MASVTLPVLTIKPSAFTSVYTQGAVDPNGIPYECTEARALILTLGGDLLLATGRWEDTTPGTGQILRYLGGGQWFVEHTSRYQTIAGIANVSFPDIGVDLTLAGVWGTAKTPVLTRNAATKTWTEFDIPLVPSGGAQIRSFGRHIDAVDGRHLVFAGQDPVGVLVGVCSPGGAIAWSTTPELKSDPNGFRVMAFAEMGPVIYCVMGETIYARVDGSGTWTAVGTNPNPGVTNPGLGALRGLIASPYNDGTLWMWNCSSSGAHANALLSFDPVARAWKTIFSFPQGGGIEAYNTINFINGVVHIGGQRAGATHIVGTPASGFQVRTVPQLGTTPAVAVRSIAQDAQGNIYFSGYDCDGKSAHRTGWVYAYRP